MEEVRGHQPQKAVTIARERERERERDQTLKTLHYNLKHQSLLDTHHRLTGMAQPTRTPREEWVASPPELTSHFTTNREDLEVSYRDPSPSYHPQSLKTLAHYQNPEQETAFFRPPRAK